MRGHQRPQERVEQACPLIVASITYVSSAGCVEETKAALGAGLRTGGEVSILIRLGITGGPTSPLSVSGLVRTLSGTH